MKLSILKNDGATIKEDVLSGNASSEGFRYVDQGGINHLVPWYSIKKFAFAGSPSKKQVDYSTAWRKSRSDQA